MGSKMIASNFAPLDQPFKQACPGCADAEPLTFKFSYAYQPIVDVASKTIYGHEALVRGPNGEGALTVLGNITDQNRYRFDQACRVKAIKGAANLGVKEKLSINFLPNAIYKPEVCIRTTLEAARSSNFPLSQIIFEATEGEAIDDGRWLAGIFREYSASGFLTAIDDFGAGYAGLNLLADFQPDIVKLDMALVRNVDTSRSRQSITRGVVRICNELNIAVLAEGIETASERDFFWSEGVTLMQGYFFSKPVFEGLGVIESSSWV